MRNSGKDSFEYSLSQNILEIFTSGVFYDAKMDYLMDKFDYLIGEYNINGMLEEHGLSDIKMIVSLLQDPDILDKLNFARMGQSGLTVTKGVKFDDFKERKLDQVQLNTTLFFSLYKDKLDDYAVLPISIGVDIFTAFRKAHGSPFGHNQEVAMEHGKPSL